MADPETGAATETLGGGVPEDRAHGRPDPGTDPGPVGSLEEQPGTQPGPGQRARRGRRVLGALALAGVVTGLILAGLGAAAGIDPLGLRGPSTAPGARIAAVEDGTGLVVIDERTGTRTSYPVAGVTFGFPAWSPDGSRIAVVGQDADATAIYVFDADPGRDGPAEPVVRYRSPDRPPFYLYWTPDGRRISFLTTEAPDRIALRVVPVDGDTPVGADDSTVIREGAPLYFEWLDGERALLHVGVGADAFTGQVGLDGVPVGEAIDASGAFRPASLSSGGRYVAYATAGDGVATDVVVEAADGSASHRVAVFGTAAMLFDPAGESLAVVAPDNPADAKLGLPVGPLQLVDPATGATRTLLDGIVVGWFWAPDGRTIAALRAVGTGPDPGAADVPRVSRLAVARLPASPSRAVAGADGPRAGLVFVDVATGAVRSERMVTLARHFVDQLLPYFDQYALSHRLWSPDARSLLLPLVDAAGVERLTVIPADGSEPHAVADGAKGFWSP